MHPNLAHLLLTINQQQGRKSNKLAFCSSLTTSTLVPNPITTDSYFLTLNKPVRKGHLRHGHKQLLHKSQRDHKPTTHKWMYYPHTSIGILFELLLKDKLHWRSFLIFLLVLQKTTLSLRYQILVSFKDFGRGGGLPTPSPLGVV